MGQLHVEVADENQLAGSLRAADFKERMLALGEERGFLKDKDILDAWPETLEHTELLPVLTDLVHKGVKFANESKIEHQDEEETSEAEFIHNPAQLQESINDSVALYLRDIGKLICLRQLRRYNWPSA